MLSGTLAQYERPDWDPLIDFVGLEVVGCFMWMDELELEDGLRVHAYKSIATRRYLHLGIDGRAFAYRADRPLRGDHAARGARGGVHRLGGPVAGAA